MRYSMLKYKLLIFMGVLAFSMVYSSANAAVMGFVDKTQTNIITDMLVSPDGKYVYTTELGSESVVNVYMRDADSGRLTRIQSISESQFNTMTALDYNPYHLEITSDSRHVYMSADDFVLHFVVNSDGSLSYTGNKVDIGETSYDLQISKDGKFVFAGSSNIYILKRESSTGNISLGSSLLFKNPGNEHQTYPSWFTAGKDGETLYASSALDHGHLYVISLNGANGAPSIKEFYVQEGEPDYQSVKHIGEKLMTLGAGRGFVSADGNFLYTVGGSRVGSSGEGSISIFKIKSDGSLTPFKNVISPEDERSTLRILYSSDQYIQLSPDQKFLFVSDSIQGFIGVWRRNLSSGDLSYVGKIDVTKAPVNAGGTSGATGQIVISPDGRHLYDAVGNASNDIVVFDLRSDMSVVKSGPSGSIEPSDTINYTLAVTNNGPSDSQNVVATDTLPAGTSFISGTVNSPTGSCSASGQKVTCSMGAFAVNDGYNAIIKVKAPATEGSIINTVKVTADQLDTKTNNNTDSVSTNIGSGGSTPSTPSTGGGSSSGGGSIPLNILALLSLVIIRRYSFRIKA